MNILVAELLIQYAWPVAFVVVATYAAAVGRQWLQQRAIDVTKHVAERDVEWAQKFDDHARETERRIAHMERALQAQRPEFNPMGKHYNPRA